MTTTNVTQIGPTVDLTFARALVDAAIGAHATVEPYDFTANRAAYNVSTPDVAFRIEWLADVGKLRIFTLFEPFGDLDQVEFRRLLPYGTKSNSIRVSTSRPLQHIANDIGKRFLPNAVAETVRVRTFVNERLEDHGARTILRKKLETLGATVTGSNSPADPLSMWLNGTRVTIYSDSVNVDCMRLSHEQAEIVLGVLAGTFTAVPTDKLDSLLAAAELAGPALEKLDAIDDTINDGSDGSGGSLDSHGSAG